MKIELTNKAGEAVEAILQGVGEASEIRRRGKTHLWNAGRSLCGLQWPRNLSPRLPIGLQEELRSGMVCKKCLSSTRRRLIHD